MGSSLLTDRKMTGQVDVSLGTIDRSLGQGQRLGEGQRLGGIKHLPEPGAVSRNLFSRPDHFCQAMELCPLSHRQP